MQVFFLDRDPDTAASYHCDKHVVKQVLESAQLLSTAHRILDNSDVGYKATHRNHPCAVWARTNRENYLWLYNLFRALCAEYTQRYGRIHATERKLMVALSHFPKNLPIGNATEPPQAMLEEFRRPDPVEGYRNYYILAKKDICKWNHSTMPPWWPNNQM